MFGRFAHLWLGYWLIWYPNSHGGFSAYDNEWGTHSQKQPSTMTATLRPGNAMSTLTPATLYCLRNRSPLPHKIERKVRSGRVSVDRILRITSLRSISSPSRNQSFR